ncbi:COP23 domain-containing protein [Sphaerospermopsis aphanizomenoides BCCUSP55]|uniref:COP23 domain-containing protein n=1 Tax=Sphaerospermopsis aphanizomenoides TaxID=459663 RepID=UPI001902DF77|nr:COP23 domain-containing protein [Sphaerospermopsis aphanizomenoides]MBK1989142.1 COP23 domain-containing protein [Sphaerospermopsis aphanizomenoides BCCUSP55]
MLRKSLAILSGAVIVSTLGAAVSSPSYAQVGPFSCDTNSLTTVVGARRAPVMRWRTNEFAGSGYDSVRRCVEVSSRFNHFYSTGQLNYITAGIVRGMPVVCATSGGGSCDSSNVLFTLNRRNSRNVAGILQTLFDNRAGATGAIVNESSERVYIDVNKMLTELGVTGSASGQTEPGVINNSPETTPSTTPGGNVW